ncbi:glycoside hydrolase family 5 protein [Sphingobacterium phlebotomi]|uniref:Glycoside hydrolase family 5 protein n=1 Tax=Sphingobacterium phlebotomi TaxID=2605433 RepID=A0A5D4HBQ7_9SPHI|nr:glycoside hydrolase family 5 protein [Sphingobacterium phlebotomi]TYR37752.1 glycoside hydrolase family 5 protein [Sphingobacterium phlebotomi]
MKRIIFLSLLIVSLSFTIKAQDLDMPFGVNLAGAEFAHDQIPGIYGKNYIYPTTEEIDYFKSKGLTLLRVPFLWERMQPVLGGELDPIELNRLKTFINAAQERNVWIIPDMHNYCRRYVGGTRYIIGSSEVTISHLADAWRKLAAELKSYNNIWGYGVMNEPHDLLENVSWFSIVQATIQEIRKEDMKTTIIVAGDSWSSASRWPTFSGNLKYLKDPSDNLIFEGHIYFDDDASGSYKGSYEDEKASETTGISRAIPFVEWLKKNNLRGFIGEYGVPDTDPRWLVTLDKLLAYLQKNGVNGTYWAAGPQWGKYKLAVEPINGVDRPQMKVLEKYKFADKVKY